MQSSLKDGVSKFDSASIEGGFQLIQGSQIYEQHTLPRSDEKGAAVKTSSNHASTMKGEEASKEAESEKREDKAVKKSENSEYAVLIPDDSEIKEPVIEAEVHIHHRSRLSQHGMQIEGKRRSTTPINETRNN